MLLINIMTIGHRSYSSVLVNNTYIINAIITFWFLVRWNDRRCDSGAVVSRPQNIKRWPDMLGRRADLGKEGFINNMGQNDWDGNIAAAASKGVKSSSPAIPSSKRHNIQSTMPELFKAK